MDASVKHQNGATLRDLGHLHPVGFGEDSESILVDTTHPGIEPMPQLADEDAREAALEVLRWVLVAVGRDGMGYEAAGASIRAGLNGMRR